jgi:DNA polymerase III epsilon subunit-like protein
MMELIGTPKQQKWGYTIYQDFHQRFGEALPDVQDAAWWIANRNIASLLELQEKAQAYKETQTGSEYTPFTAMYPRHARKTALQALGSLPTTLAVLDTETTGINKKGEVCELTMIEYPSRRVLFNSLIHPKDFNPSESVKAMSKNGITWEELSTAPTLLDVWEDVVSSLTAYHLLAFNADFDVPMIRFSAWKWGITAPRVAASCLMKLATALMEMDYYLSLEEACTLFEVNRISYGNTHRALADTLATCDLLECMRKMSEESDRRNV